MLWKNKIYCLIICIFTFGITGLLYGENEVLICAGKKITADFENDSASERLDLDIKQWKIADGVLKNITGATGTASFTIGKTEWTNYAIIFKIKRLAENSKDQHFGIKILSDDQGAMIKIYCNGDTVYYTYSESKQTRENMIFGNIKPGMAAGEKAEWASFGMMISNNMATISIDDATIGNPKKIHQIERGRILFYAYNVTVALDDFIVSVYKGETAKESKEKANIIQNKCLAITRQDMLKYILTPDQQGNIIPDFSAAGYMGGGVKLPEVPVVMELSPNPPGDDRLRIQTALDKIGEKQADKNGFRGALLLKAGEYRVDGSLFITNSGVVLRGAGQFPGGTSIIGTKISNAAGRAMHSLIYLGNPVRAGATEIEFLQKKNETVISSRIVPVGSKKIVVKSAKGFNAGDNIVIEVFPNMKWLETLKLQNDWSWMTVSNKTFNHFRYEREITDIKDNQLTLDAPNVHYLDEAYLDKALVWKYLDNVRITHSGVEKLRLISLFAGEYSAPEHFLHDEKHTANGVYIYKAKDCWVKNITALHFHFSAVNICRGARNITVQDSAYLQPVARIYGSRRYPFLLCGSRSLIQRCYAEKARHAFATTFATMGPNVFLDCLADKNFYEIGPHQIWNTGTLYDNIYAPYDGRFYARNAGGVHGWRGVNQVFWNCKGKGIVCEKPVTGDQNWAIGNIASEKQSDNYKTGIKEKSGNWISHGRRVSPRSLYLWQLENRLGKQAVENITVEIQRQEEGDKKIEDYLKTTLPELSERERANDHNLLKLDNELQTLKAEFKMPPGKNAFSMADTWARSPWNVDPLPDMPLKRIINPVYNDDSAVVVPAKVSVKTKVSHSRYPDELSATNTEYLLRFDYKMEVGAAFKPKIEYTIIKTGTYENGSVFEAEEKTKDIS
ncbi:MAG TPA: hypothetical protein DC049_01700, partial [Spirochaetia bacterium]|nr:hypothetical protein [Spirochaetia bacterium]